ncbi:MAG: 50S ribosomal protein L4 [bacterium]
METAIFNMNGQEVGKCVLPEAMFGEKPKSHFLHEAITSYLANQRAGTHATKTRAGVSGGGRKPWKQKGTGRARAGSTRSPIWRKGGVVFGPHPRSHRREMPWFKRRTALVQALSAKFSDGNLIVLDAMALAEARTKMLARMLKALKTEGKVLFVSGKPDAKVQTAGRNLPGFTCCQVADLNAFRVLSHDKTIFTRDAIEAVSSLWKEGRSDD